MGTGCALGGLAGPFGPPLPRILLVISLLFLALAIGRRSAVALWLATFAVGSLLGSSGSSKGEVGYRLFLLREVKGGVASMPEPHPRTLSFVLEHRLSGTRLLVYVPKGTEIRPGDTALVKGRFERPGGGWGEYLGRRGIVGVFWGKEAEVLERGGPSIMGYLFSLRSSLARVISLSFPDEAASLVAALLLGVRGDLAFEVKEGFRRAGVAHLLALSGLHLGIIAYGIWWLLGLSRIRTGRRYLILFAAVGVYVGLSGGRVSLVRAGLMFGALGLFRVLWEHGLVLRDWYDPLQALSAAAIVVLSIWPWSALDLGFQLSFAAAGAIVWGWPYWRDHPLRGPLPRIVRYPLDLLWVSVCAQLGTAGIVGSSFGYLAPYALLANPVLIPWTALIIWSGLAVLVLYPLGVGPFIGGIAGRYLASPYLRAVAWISSLPGASLPVGRYFGLWYLFAALVIISLWNVRLRRGVESPSGKGGRWR